MMMMMAQKIIKLLRKNKSIFKKIIKNMSAFRLSFMGIQEIGGYLLQEIDNRRIFNRCKNIPRNGG